MKTFGSPWRWSLYRGSVSAIRRLLRITRLPETGFVRWLVSRQNQRVLQYVHRHPARSVLLIMPRCLKHTGCPVDVRGSLQACLTCACHDCPLADVASLTAGYGVRALVAFRSHIAFAMARREQPDLIVATACDDRLIKALHNVPDIPALLAPLASMERPCVNATADLSWVADQLRLVFGADGRTAATTTGNLTTETPTAMATGADSRRSAQVAGGGAVTPQEDMAPPAGRRPSGKPWAERS